MRNNTRAKHKKGIFYILDMQSTLERAPESKRHCMGDVFTASRRAQASEQAAGVAQTKPRFISSIKIHLCPGGQFSLVEQFPHSYYFHCCAIKREKKTLRHIE